MAAIRDIPPGLPSGLGPMLQDMRTELEAMRAYVDAQNFKPRTLAELLKGTAARATSIADLPAVPVYKVETFPTTIIFYLPTIESWPQDAMIELYRAVGAAATSAQAQRVSSTTPRVSLPSTPGTVTIQSVSAQVLSDTPPPAESYVYFLRFASTDGLRAGPFSPFNGVPFTASASADPEAGFDVRAGGVFLETFENTDFESTWQKYDGGAPLISYPNTGVVGGRVVSIAGAEEWRAFKRFFEFEPGQVYRMKVGLRLAADPSNGSTATKARLRAGFMCFDQDRNIKDTTGGSSYVSSHWFCAFDINLHGPALTTYQEFTGYLQGLGATPTNNATDVSNPSVARSGTKYWTPVLVVNYDDGNGTTEVDYVRVEQLNPLDVAFTGELTNESVTLPADNAGNVASYAGATGTFNVRYGVQPIDPARVTFSISGNPQSLTASINAAGVFLVTTGFDSGEATASLVLRAVYNGSQLERTFSMAKALSGADGADGVVTGVRLLADNQIFTFDQTGAAEPTLQTINFTSLRNGVTDPTTWTTTPSVTLGGVGDTRSLTIANFGANTSVLVRAESEGYFDEVTVHRIAAGKDAVVAILTNEAIVLTASSTGVVAVYTGAAGFFNVFNGTTDVTAAATKTVQANPQALTVTGPNATTGAWSISGGFDAVENTATLTLRAVYGGVTIDKTIFLAKAFTGAAGEDGDDGLAGAAGAPGSAGTPGPALFTLVSDGGVTITPNTVTKTGGTPNTWDAAARSTQGFPSCFVTARAGQTNKGGMFGLSRNPVASTSYVTIEYAFYLAEDGNLTIYESSVNTLSLGAYTTAMAPQITYDGRSVRYIVSGVVVRTVPLLGASLFFDSSFYSSGFVLLDITFGPMGRAGDSSAQLVFLETWEHQSFQSFYNNRVPSGAVVTYPNNGEFGGKVLRAAGSLLWIASLENLPFDPNTLYKITAKVRRTVASTIANELVYIGVEGVAADGVTLINVSGANSAGSQHYNCFSGVNFGAIPVGQWVEQTGYFRGLSGVAGAGGNMAPNIESPTPLFTGVHYFRPLVILNYNGGDGTTECDYIRVERLTAKDDADNTDKRRIVPDAEFSLATDETYWRKSNAPGLSFLTSGGFNGGYASWVASPGFTSQFMFSRRNPPAQSIAGQQFIVTVRWRRRNTIVDAAGQAGILRVGAMRHNDPNGDVAAATGTTESYGGVALYTSEMNVRAVDAWQEDVGLCVIPTNRNPYTAVALPFVSAMVAMQNVQAGTLEIDYVDVSPGTPASLPRLEPPGVGNFFLSPWDLFHNIVHSAAAARQYILPPVSVTLGTLPGAKTFFQQLGTGQLSVRYANGPLLSSPNLTTNPRPLLGRSARAVAEYTGDGTGSGGPADNWTITGELG